MNEFYQRIQDTFYGGILNFPISKKSLEVGQHVSIKDASGKVVDTGVITSVRDDETCVVEIVKEVTIRNCDLQ